MHIILPETLELEGEPASTWLGSAPAIYSRYTVYDSTWLARTNVLICGRAAFLATNRDGGTGREKEVKCNQTAPLVSLLWLRAQRPHASRYCLVVTVYMLSPVIRIAPTRGTSKRERCVSVCACACVRATKTKDALPGQPWLVSWGPPRLVLPLGLVCPRKDQGCHAMPCHVRPSPTPPRRDAAGCRASEPTGAWTGGPAIQLSHHPPNAVPQPIPSPGRDPFVHSSPLFLQHS